VEGSIAKIETAVEGGNVPNEWERTGKEVEVKRVNNIQGGEPQS